MGGAGARLQRGFPGVSVFPACAHRPPAPLPLRLSSLGFGLSPASPTLTGTSLPVLPLLPARFSQRRGPAAAEGKGSWALGVPGPGRALGVTTMSAR